MVDGLIYLCNRTKKPFAIALSGAGRVLRGSNDGSNVTNWYTYICLIVIVTMNSTHYN
jgi:hypothetical protein